MKSKLTLLLVILIAGCNNKNQEPVDLLITNVNIISLENGKVIANQNIAINSDTIFEITSSEAATRYKAFKEVNADGKFIMQGLWDNHVHFRGGDTLAKENKNLLPLFLRYGITTVRDAGGDITPAVLKWQKDIEEGDLPGPTIFTSGPKLDGERPAWPGSIKITKKEDVKHALDSLQKIDADYVKTYDGSLSAEIYYEIIKQAEEREMKVTGHMPMSANIDSAINFGLDGSEHIYYVLKGCSPIEDSLTKENLGYGMIPSVIETYDESLANSLFIKMSDNNVYITPTLYIGKKLSLLADEDHTKDSLLQYIGKGIQQTYRGRIESAIRAKQSGSTFRQQVNTQAMEMIRPIQNAGVSILAGSDCGPYNSFVYPGESLHGELRMLVEAGLTPQEALTTSITNGAQFFDSRENYSIKEGAIADLIIMNKNPLDDISNLTSLYGVIKSGNYFTVKELQSLIDETN